MSTPENTIRSKRGLLMIVCLAQFMVILDISIVNVALPSIHSSLGFSDTGLQWVVNAYTLTFAGFLMLAGRATDLLPRRQIFLVGVSLFSLASLGCALADSQAVLDGALEALSRGEELRDLVGGQLAEQPHVLLRHKQRVPTE